MLAQHCSVPPQQAPPQHAADPQLVPHAPQLLESVCRSVHAVGHSDVPLGQTHAPAEQIPPGKQAMPQLPQFCGSVDVSEQRSSQQLSDELQNAVGVIDGHPPHEVGCDKSTQLPSQHPGGFPPHCRPQTPQFIGSYPVSTHAPAHGVCMVPAGIVGHTQAPPAQVDPAIMLWQSTPQNPQFIGSLFVSTQALPHTICPVGHSQTPVTQLAPLAHAAPHSPQLAGSLDRFASHPSIGLPSQSAKPTTHEQALAAQCEFVPQRFAQAPQLLSSVVT
jgi:hypothetical protein